MSRLQRPRRFPSRRLQVKTAIFLIVVVTTGPLGAVFLREGMRHADLTAGLNPVILIEISRMILTNGEVWLGLASRIVSALAFMFLLSWADYSFVNPATSVSFAIAVFLGWAMLGEVVPPGRWIGAILICLGVFFIGKTPARTTEFGEEQGQELLYEAPGSLPGASTKPPSPGCA